MLRTLLSGRAGRPRCLLVAAVFFLTACASDRNTTPTKLVLQFYTMRDAVGIDGAPTESQLAAIRPFISDTLAILLGEADALRAQQTQLAPDEKPAFADGDIFSSLFEGPTSYRPQEPIGTGNTVLVPTIMANDREKPAVVWTDTVVVVKVKGHWRVQDVRYGGTWAFGNKGALLQSLATTPPDSL